MKNIIASNINLDDQLFFNELQSYFRQKLYFQVDRNNFISFDELIKMIELELKIMFTDTIRSSLFDIYLNNIEQKYLFDLCHEAHFEELIFLGGEHYFFKNATDQKSAQEKMGIYSSQDFEKSLEVLCIKNGIDWNFQKPFASFNLTYKTNAYRFTIIHRSTTTNQKTHLYIRKSNQSMHQSFLTPSTDAFYRDMILQKKNILIAGATGSGKTSLLTEFLSLVPASEHIITLEDTHEIAIPSHLNKSITQLVSNNKCSGKSLVDYCAYALRMAPDRIVLGELRSHEVIPFILSMNTGHNGMMSTIHANSAYDALLRLHTLFSLYSDNQKLNPEIFAKLIFGNLDYVVFLKDKKIKEVIRVLGAQKELPLFERVIFS